MMTSRSSGPLTLRPYQKDCIQTIQNLDLSKDNSYLVQMATGLGKTVTFSRIPRQGRMLILSHREELVTQPVKYFDVPVGIEQANRTSQGEEVISASVQSLVSNKRYKKFSPDYFDLIITDEAHHAAAKTYQELYKYFKPRLHLGFTATPNRHDKIGLFPIFKQVIYEYNLKQAIEDGWLCPINCIRARVQVDFNHIRSQAGDFVVSNLEGAMLRESNVDAIVQAYNEYAKGPTLIFAVSVKHAKAIADRIPGSKVILGSTPSDERAQILQDFKDGKVDCLVNCMVLTEGTDLPNVESIIIARPTQSETLYSQMVGRGCRKCEGKDKLNLIDVVGVTQCHRLCTAPILIGQDPSIVPDGLSDTIQGDLLGLEEKINMQNDTIDNWIRSVELVDLMAKELDLDTHDINFTRMPDGSLQVLDNHRTKPPNALANGKAMQYEIDRIYDHLQTFHASERPLWDLKIVRRWGNKPASPEQKKYINDLTNGEYRKEVRGLNKYQASQVIERLKGQKRKKARRKY